MSTLPADASTPGNSYCAACDQSIATSRVATHLNSKKHADALQKAAGEGKAAPVLKASVEATKPKKSAKPTTTTASPTPSPPSDNAAPKTKKAAKASEADIGLPRDPQDESRYWCNICKSSLDATRAATHLSTEKHRKAEDKFLSDTMRTARIS